MYLKQKYIRTEKDIIIVFPELMQHSQFKSFNPISAGFINIFAERVEVRNIMKQIANVMVKMYRLD